MSEKNVKEAALTKAAVIVAHPDDETIWGGGTIALYPGCMWTIAAMTRASDPDRSVKFSAMLDLIRAAGRIADLDDSPDQPPLTDLEIEREVLASLADGNFDVVITHSIYGEYTRHLRHEQVGAVISSLWLRGAIKAGQLWMFAYEDDNGGCLPHAIKRADRLVKLPAEVWRRKRDIITGIYGFTNESFEARAAGEVEGFWCFSSPSSFHQWLGNGSERK